MVATKANLAAGGTFGISRAVHVGVDGTQEDAMDRHALALKVTMPVPPHSCQGAQRKCLTV